MAGSFSVGCELGCEVGEKEGLVVGRILGNLGLVASKGYWKGKK